MVWEQAFRYDAHSFRACSLIRAAFGAHDIYSIISWPFSILTLDFCRILPFVQPPACPYIHRIVWLLFADSSHVEQWPCWKLQLASACDIFYYWRCSCASQTHSSKNVVFPIFFYGGMDSGRSSIDVAPVHPKHILQKMLFFQSFFRWHGLWS